MRSIARSALSYFSTVARAHLAGPRAVAIYGSHALDGENKWSDIDVLFVSRDGTETIDVLVDSVEAFSKLHGLPLDQEIPYSNKLLTSYDELAKSALCHVYSEGFTPVIAGAAYAASPVMRERLLVNILTTPVTVWEEQSGPLAEIRKTAGLCLRQVATTRRLSGAHMEDVLEMLIGGREGAYKGWLGYKDQPAIREHLRSILEEPQ